MTEVALQGFCVTAVCRLTVVVISFAVCVHSQSMTGTLAGTVVNGNGLPLSGVTVRLTGHPAAFRAQVATNARGEFQFVLPYGDYEIRADSTPAVALHVYALHVTYSSLMVGPASAVSAATDPGSSDAPRSVRIVARHGLVGCYLSGLLQLVWSAAKPRARCR